MPNTSMTLNFWFDFASTYSYPAAMRIEKLAANHGVSVVWRPFLLGPIFAAQGWTDSPFNLQPEKGRYMWRDLERLCQAEGIAFRRPSQFPRNSLLAARVACYRPSRGAWSMRTYQAEFPNARDECDIPLPDLQRQDKGTAGQSERSARFYTRLISSSARSRRSRSAVISTSLKSRGRLSTTQRVPMQLPSSRSSGTPA